MTDEDLLRYSRHILLDEIGVEGQDRLRRSRVMIIGAGGLGCPAATYLASSGVGSMTLVDADRVDLTNLQRQVLHSVDRVGMLKVHSAVTRLRELNPLVDYHAHPQNADETWLTENVHAHDLILDCSDNFLTRHQVNSACHNAGVPLVSGASIQFDGQIFLYDPREVDSACYACIFPAERTPQEARCATMGVFAPLTGIIGTMQAALGLKHLLNLGLPAINRLGLFDAKSLDFSWVQLSKSKNCSVCSRPR